MKSSTIRRSTLSKETMEVIENLAKEQAENNSLGEYVRPEEIEQQVTNSTENNSMSQEIDLLWQNFKTTQFNTNSPTAYIFLGFFIGVLATLLTLVGISAIANKSNTTHKTNFLGIERIFNHKQKVQEKTLEEQTEYKKEDISQKVSIPEENETTTAQEEKTKAEQNAETTEQTEISNKHMKKYIVKNGDTVETIIKKNYGTFSPEKAELIKKANKLDTLDRINIDQELLIPMD